MREVRLREGEGCDEGGEGYHVLGVRLCMCVMMIYIRLCMCVMMIYIRLCMCVMMIFKNR